MNAIAYLDESADGWERSLYAFLAEKQRRSGSMRTVVGYSRMLNHFFAAVGHPPDRVTSPELFTWAYGNGLSGKEPSAITIVSSGAWRTRGLGDSGLGDAGRDQAA